MRAMCEMSLGVAPKVQLDGHTDLTLPYFPTHVHYILLELLKNSGRATVEHHGAKREADLPPIRITLARGREDVTIRVAGRGGGIARSEMKKVFRYSLSPGATTRPPIAASRTPSLATVCPLLSLLLPSLCQALGCP